MDGLCRSLHTCPHRRRPTECLCHAGRHPGRCNQSRSEADGRRVQGHQRPSDWLDTHLPCPIRNLSRRSGLHHRRTYRSSAFPPVGQRNGRVVRPTVLRASDRAAKRGDVNLHYGSEPGSKFYSHLSDQYGYFSILPISPTESEAAYVLDGLFDQDTVLDIQEHFTDTGGASDHVFGLFALIGKRFAPRLPNLKPGIPRFRSQSRRQRHRPLEHRLSDRAATHLRMADRTIPNDLLKHVSPLSWDTSTSQASTPRILSTRCPKASDRFACQRQSDGRHDVHAPSDLRVRF